MMFGNSPDFTKTNTTTFLSSLTSPNFNSEIFTHSYTKQFSPISPSSNVAYTYKFCYDTFLLPLGDDIFIFHDKLLTQLKYLKNGVVDQDDIPNYALKSLPPSLISSPASLIPSSNSVTSLSFKNKNYSHP